MTLPIGTCPDCLLGDGQHVQGCPGYRDPAEEAEWNQAHGLTAKCAECGGAMKDDGRTLCSWNCWHRAQKEKS